MSTFKLGIQTFSKAPIIKFPLQLGDNLLGNDATHHVQIHHKQILANHALLRLEGGTIEFTALSGECFYKSQAEWLPLQTNCSITLDLDNDDFQFRLGDCILCKILKDFSKAFKKKTQSEEEFPIKQTEPPEILKKSSSKEEGLLSLSKKSILKQSKFPDRSKPKVEDPILKLREQIQSKKKQLDDSLQEQVKSKNKQIENSQLENPKQILDDKIELEPKLVSEKIKGVEEKPEKPRRKKRVDNEKTDAKDATKDQKTEKKDKKMEESQSKVLKEKQNSKFEQAESEGKQNDLGMSKKRATFDIDIDGNEKKLEQILKPNIQPKEEAPKNSKQMLQKLKQTTLEGLRQTRSNILEKADEEEEKSAEKIRQRSRRTTKSRSEIQNQFPPSSQKKSTLRPKYIIQISGFLLSKVELDWINKKNIKIDLNSSNFNVLVMEEPCCLRSMKLLIAIAKGGLILSRRWYYYFLKEQFSLGFKRVQRKK